jgi:hypothetical protein
MRVELNVPESVTQPRMWVKHQPVLAMALRTGSIEIGLRRSEVTTFTFDIGEMSLVPRHFEERIRTKLGGINRLAACFTQQAHGRCSAIRREQTVFLDLKLPSR